MDADNSPQRRRDEAVVRNNATARRMEVRRGETRRRRHQNQVLSIESPIIPA